MNSESRNLPLDGVTGSRGVDPVFILKKKEKRHLLLKDQTGLEGTDQIPPPTYTDVPKNVPSHHRPSPIYKYTSPPRSPPGSLSPP